MEHSADREVLEGFVAEVSGYLPGLRQTLDDLRRGGASNETLREAYRRLHNIRGAAAMVGLEGLSRIAADAEQLVEQLRSGQRHFDADAEAVLSSSLSAIAYDLDGLASTPSDEPAPRVSDVPERPAGIEEAPPLMAPGVSSEIRTVFLDEANEHLQTIGSQTRKLSDDPGNRELLQSIRRTVHTLKGASATVGFVAMGRLSHRMEDLLDRFYERRQGVPRRAIDLLFSTTDVLEDLAAGTGDETALREGVEELFLRYDGLLESEESEPETIASRESAVPPVAPQGVSEPIPIRSEAPTETTVPGQMVRVPVERIDDLVRLAGELVVQRSAFEGYLQQLRTAAEELHLGFSRVRRLSRQLEDEYGSQAQTAGNQDAPRLRAVSGPGARSAEFDSLEFDSYSELYLISRELTETSADVTAIESQLRGTLDGFRSYLDRLGRLSQEAQDKLIHLRMVPISSLGQRLHRAARVAARDQEKKIELRLSGETVELDKSLLESLADPLLHLLRNAVDHGIETPSERRAAGKPEMGVVEVTAHHRGSQVEIRVRDDGAGLDVESLKAAAVRKGILSEDAASRLSSKEAERLIFFPGLSTSETVSELSGRGVGLDAVNVRVKNLQGTLEVESKPAEGTLFTLSLPLTLVVTRVLMLKTHGETFAIPMSSVSQVLRVSREELSKCSNDGVLVERGQRFPLMRLTDVFPLPRPFDDAREHLPILILSDRSRKKALAVEQILGAREVVVKPLGTLLRRARGFLGATLAGDGGVTLILDVGDLLQPTPVGVPEEPTEPVAEEVSPARGKQGLDVLIVDDSLSVRRVLTSFVSNAGWKPETAKDGVEALERIHEDEWLPDVVLLDIEMPRMDGYEFTATVRSQENLSSLPIIMITSRAGEKHRRKAFDLGATEYLVKPYQEEVLLDTIRRVTAPKEALP